MIETWNEREWERLYPVVPESGPDMTRFGGAVAVAVQFEGVEGAGREGERLDVGAAQQARDGARTADLDFVEGQVAHVVTSALEHRAALPHPALRIPAFAWTFATAPPMR